MPRDLPPLSWHQQGGHLGTSAASTSHRDGLRGDCCCQSTFRVWPTLTQKAADQGFLEVWASEPSRPGPLAPCPGERLAGGGDAPLHQAPNPCLAFLRS